MLTGIEYLFIALAAVVAGAVNALAGGGTLLTFPVLVALGLPPVSANVTNTVALSPGYLGGTYAQRNDLRDQKRRLWLYIPAGLLGGLLGGVILLITDERIFSAIVPYLILLACALLAAQDRLKAWLQRRRKENAAARDSDLAAVLPLGLAAVYGGYFGAGVSVILLAVLGLTLDDNLTRLNALKQAISFATNVTAAVFFAFSGQVVWPAALVMMVGALLGGALGGKLAGRIKPATLRALVVTIGVIVALVYLFR